MVYAWSYNISLVQKAVWTVSIITHFYELEIIMYYRSSWLFVVWKTGAETGILVIATESMNCFYYSLPCINEQFDIMSSWWWA